MMEEARTSETSVDNYFTRQYIPEDKSEIHSCSSHDVWIFPAYKNILLLQTQRKRRPGTSILFGVATPPALNMEAALILKRRRLLTSPHGVATQKTSSDMFTALRTSGVTDLGYQRI
jgi:hypothetical protein